MQRFFAVKEMLRNNLTSQNYFIDLSLVFVQLCKTYKITSLRGVKRRSNPVKYSNKIDTSAKASV